jgi:hypothetical protein
MQACEYDIEQLESIEPIELMPHQKEAVSLLDNGRILYGGVGAGKSATVLAYYIERELPKDIFIITTAKKRDSLEWMAECAKFGLGSSHRTSIAGIVTVDSWHNIGKYTSVENAFFIFDEQKVIGHGVWVKSFLKIVKKNRWVLLSATPGDTWLDYAPVFIANGWYRNITDFKREHVVYEPYIKFPIVKGYLGEAKLERLRNEVLVEMPYIRTTTRNVNFLQVGHDKEELRAAIKHRWNTYENRPMKDAAELFRVMRKIVYSDPSRIETIRFLLKFHDKLIVFYNFDYELDILRGLTDEVNLAEWNGHKKQPIPDTKRWVYLVQYMAGGEGWNCTETDSMVLYSLTYSYKNYLQSQGRIDRMDTPFEHLYYYILLSGAGVDRAVKRALDAKKSFNERDEYRKFGGSAFMEV